MDEFERATKSGVSRRTVAKAVAWAGPAIAVAATIPVAAASLRKDPGINGWVLSTINGDDCRYSVDVDSDPSGGSTTPDGAPYGLYVYDAADQTLITNATLTYWIIGDHTSSNQVTWDTRSGHSGCWTGPTPVGTETKPDGILYTGYRWTHTCAIDATARVTGTDGVERVFLNNFHVRARFRQPTNLCGNVTYWAQRHVTIDPDGAGGSAPAETLTFQRRNGSLGPMSGARRMAAPPAGDANGVAAS